MDQFNHKVSNLQIPFDKSWVFSNKQTLGANGSTFNTIPNSTSSITSMSANNSNSNINDTNTNAKLTKAEKKKLKKKLIYDATKAKHVIIKKFKSVFEKGNITKSHISQSKTATQTTNTQDSTDTTPNNPNNTTNNANNKKLYIWEGNALDSDRMNSIFSTFIDLLNSNTNVANRNNNNIIDFGFDNIDENGKTERKNTKSKTTKEVTFQVRTTWNIAALDVSAGEYEMSRGLSVTNEKDREPTMTLEENGSTHNQPMSLTVATTNSPANSAKPSPKHGTRFNRHDSSTTPSENENENDNDNEHGSYLNVDIVERAGSPSSSISAV